MANFTGRLLKKTTARFQSTALGVLQPADWPRGIFNDK